jgi:hypothetical protein
MNAVTDTVAEADEIAAALIAELPQGWWSDNEGGTRLAMWNDVASRTQADVVDLFRRAEARCAG